MALTDTAIKNVKASEKPQKLFDGGGLFLLVAPNGGKWWRLKYRFGGKEKLISVGCYPEVSLKGARDRRDEHRKQLASDIDPGAQRKAEKLAKEIAGENSFEKVALEWLDARHEKWTKQTKARIKTRLLREVFPAIGKRPVSEIATPEVTALLLKVQSRGVIETAHRCFRDIRRVFRYAIATHRATTNPAAQIEAGDVLKPNVAKHHASVTSPREIGALIRAIQTYQGHAVAIYPSAAK